MTPCERAQEIFDDTKYPDPQAHDYPNKRRAARAALAILPAYDDDDAITGVKDALADLMHLCDLAGWGFADLCESAHSTYLYELEDLGPAEDEQLRRSLEEN